MRGNEPPSEVFDPERLAALRRTGLLESGPEESFDRLSALARRLTGAPTALVSLVDGDRQHFKSCLGLPEPYATAGETPLSHSICQYALSTPGPLIIPDTGTDQRLAGNRAIAELGAAAYLGIPLVGSSGHVLGSFCVLDDHPRQWTEDDVAVMTDLAASVMAEIELRELSEERRRNSAALTRSEARLRAIMDGLFIFAGLLDTDGTLLDANSAALDSAGLELDDVVGKPFWDAYWWSWDRETQDQLKRAIQRAASGVLSRYDAVVRLADDVFMPIDFQLAPLVEDGVIVRLIPSGLDITERKRSEEELTRMAAAEASHRRQAEDLLLLSQALSAAIDVADVAVAMASLGGDVVGAAFSNIALGNDDGAELELLHGARLDSAISDRWPVIPLDHSTPLGASMLTGEPQLLSSSAEIDARFPTGAADSRAAGFNALAALPVPGVPAAIGFAWSEPVDFTATLADTLGVVAELVGSALQRASIHERDRRVAEQLQRSLLPAHLPAVPGVELVSRYEAGGTGLDVGGDWFDVGSLGDGRWALAVGDVVGRGLNAAAMMGRLRNSFSALVTDSVSLHRLLDRLDLVADELADVGFSTMVGVEYCVADGAISVLSAGHPPPFIRRSDGRVERLDGSGRPLGVLVGQDRVPIHASLASDDLLFLYTDGLIERRDESIDVGLDRLTEVLAGLQSKAVDEMCDEVLAGLRPSSGDDIAMLAMLVGDRVDP